jgi:NADH:ubiquinone oxidoreductase subunit E
MLQLGFDYHENLTPEKVDELLDRCSRDEYEFKVKVQ